MKEYMLDELTNLVKPEYRFAHMKNLFDNLQDVLDMADTAYLIDKESRNQVIDYICDILETQKSTPKELQ